MLEDDEGLLWVGVHFGSRGFGHKTATGETLWIVRKGATPAFPGQRGFIGGSMDDIAVIVHGVESPQAAEALYSTVHGAGRVMSRRQAKKAVDFRRVQDRLRARGTVLRRAGADEAPEVYRKLDDVLAPHAPTIAVEHTLRPRIVVMARSDEVDP